MKNLIVGCIAVTLGLGSFCAEDRGLVQSCEGARVAVVGGSDGCGPLARAAMGVWEREVPCRVDVYAAAGAGFLTGREKGVDVLSQLGRVFASGRPYDLIVLWCSDEAEGLDRTDAALEAAFRQAVSLVRAKAPLSGLVLFTAADIPLQAARNARRKADAELLAKVASQTSVAVLDLSQDVRFPPENAAKFFAADGVGLSDAGYAHLAGWQGKYLAFIWSKGWGTDPKCAKAQDETVRMEKRTQRLHDAKWGVFNHYLGHEIKTADAWAKKVAAYDVRKVADQLEACGARFYFLTLMQGRRWMCAPNATYDRICGTKPGEACSVRDLPMELSEELSRRGIDLYLYYTGDGPYRDAELGSKFGFVEPRFIGVNRSFVDRWAAVLEEFAVRYGDRVKGWWIDGCFSNYLRYTDELMAPYRAAILKGNGEALVTMNDGVKDYYRRYTKLADFTAGEFNDFYCVPKERLVEGAQSFALIPLGAWSKDGAPGWGCAGCKRAARYVADYVRIVNENGGVVAIDVAVAADGSWLPEQMEVLKAIGRAAGTIGRKGEARVAEEVHVRAGVGNFLSKLRAGEPVTVAYLGGSITEMNGWRNMTTDWLRKGGEGEGEAKVTEVSAAIGGTGSGLGVFRVGHDALAKNPDLLFVEFATNDGSTPAEDIWRNFDGIVQQTWAKNPKTDIVFAYTITSSMMKDYGAGRMNHAASAMERLADHYGIPSVCFGPRVAAEVKAGRLVMSMGEVPTAVPKETPDRDRLIDEELKKKGQTLFAKDGVHPALPGHSFYLKSVIACFEAMRALPPADHAAFIGRPFYDGALAAAKMVPLEPSMLKGEGWTKLAPDTPEQKSFATRGGQFFRADRPGAKLVFRFRGTKCGIYDLMSPKGANVRIMVDGKVVRAANPRFDSYCWYTRLANMNVFDGAPGEHTVELEVLEKQPDRTQVKREDTNTPKYDGTYFQPCQIMLVGDLVR